MEPSLSNGAAAETAEINAESLTPIIAVTANKITAKAATTTIGNGAGKSTLLECVCGIQRATSGTIIGIEDFNKSVGYISQNFIYFLDLSVYENLLYFDNLYEVSNQRIEEVIDLCFLREKKNFIVKKLSGGYKQLLSLAIALLHEPKFLILDEPTSAMDPMFRQSFWQVIHSYNDNGGTVLVVTHFIEEVLECTKLIVLSKGTIVYDNDITNIAKEKNIQKIMQIIKEKTEGMYYG